MKTISSLLFLLLLGCQRNESPVDNSTLRQFHIASFGGIFLNARILTTGVLTNDRTVLTDSVVVSDSTLSWSPDGSKLLFTSSGQVFVINSDGTKLTKLTTDNSVNAFPIWSAEGFRIAFQSDRSGKFEIYSMNSDGSGLKRLTNSIGGARMPAWSSQTQQIAFMGDGGIHVMNADGTNDRRITNFANDFKPLWSPSGRKILFRSSRDGNNEIYMMNSDGSVQQNLSNSPTNDDDPGWAYDDLEIVFVSERDQEYDDFGNLKKPRREVYLMRVDSLTVRRLTTNSYAFSPNVSPDGLSIVYREHQDFVAGLYLLSSSGTMRNLIWGGYSPAWSPVEIR